MVHYYKYLWFGYIIPYIYKTHGDVNDVHIDPDYKDEMLKQLYNILQC